MNFSRWFTVAFRMDVWVSTPWNKICEGCMRLLSSKAKLGCLKIKISNRGWSEGKIVRINVLFKNNKEWHLLRILLEIEKYTDFVNSVQRLVIKNIKTVRLFYCALQNTNSSLCYKSFVRNQKENGLFSREGEKPKKDKFFAKKSKKKHVRHSLG